jgi:hypothetical protein
MFCFVLLLIWQLKILLFSAGQAIHIARFKVDPVLLSAFSPGFSSNLGTDAIPAVDVLKLSTG